MLDLAQRPFRPLDLLARSQPPEDLERFAERQPCPVVFFTSSVHHAPFVESAGLGEGIREPSSQRDRVLEGVGRLLPCPLPGPYHALNTQDFGKEPLVLPGTRDLYRAVHRAAIVPCSPIVSGRSGGSRLPDSSTLWSGRSLAASAGPSARL